MTFAAATAAPAIAITGIGLVSPLGNDLETAWAALRAGSSQPVRHAHRLGDEIWGEFPLFAVRDFEPRALPFSAAARAYAEATAAWADVDLMYLAGASIRAMRDAGMMEAQDTNAVGLVLTHENPGVDRHVSAILESFHAALAGPGNGALAAAGGALGEPTSGARRAAPPGSRRAVAERLYAEHRDAVYELQTFMPLHRVARLLGVHGHGLFVNNACASGLYALDAAAALVRTGRCDTVVVAGADHPTSFAKYRWFAEQQLAAEDGLMQPFDRHRHGFVLGDGGAALVVESLTAAAPRGARPYALYRGGGFNQEAWKVAFPDPASRHYEAALRAALASSALQPADLDWLVPHGAATAVADAYEARALTAVFGADFVRPRLTVLKPHVGHNLGGSGVTETALLLLAMQHAHLPAARGCDDPDPTLRLRPQAVAVAETPRFTLKCAAGFGGFNAACIFENVEP